MRWFNATEVVRNSEASDLSVNGLIVVSKWERTCCWNVCFFFFFVGLDGVADLFVAANGALKGFDASVGAFKVDDDWSGSEVEVAVVAVVAVVVVVVVVRPGAVQTGVLTAHPESAQNGPFERQNPCLGASPWGPPHDVVRGCF